MGEEIAISLKNVSKCFKRYARPVDRLKELILPSQGQSEEFWALREVSLEVVKGETLGIIGRNGSGKSTLLQIIAGILTPTSGTVKINGRVSALLELGSGFNPEFTGRQNIFFNGQILGLSKEIIQQKFDEIVAFADIGDFIEQPVKTYSSGMFVRLAFAVAVNVDPDIFIVDEALAVGDIMFQYRCMRRIRALMDSGATTLFVSHDSGAIKTLCNSAIMLHQGRIFTTGLPSAVTIEYLKAMMHQELDSPLKQEEQKEQSFDEPRKQIHPESILEQASLQYNLTRRGNRKALIEDVKLLNQSDEFCGKSPVFNFNETVTLLVKLKVYDSLQECIVGFFICDKNGNEIIGSNTYEEDVRICDLMPDEQLNVQFKFRLPLRMGSYSLTVAGANYSHETFDWLDNVIVFQVLPPSTGRHIHALVDLPIDVNVNILRKEASVQ